MQVMFKSRDREAVLLRSFARQRIRFVFRRMDWLISKATVSMSDINGPRGGLDKRCQVQGETEPRWGRAGAFLHKDLKAA